MTEYERDIVVKTVIATLQSLIEGAQSQRPDDTADWLQFYLEQTLEHAEGL